MIEVTTHIINEETKENVKFTAVDYFDEPEHYLINFGCYYHYYPKSIIKDICTLLPI